MSTVMELPITSDKVMSNEVHDSVSDWNEAKRKRMGIRPPLQGNGTFEEIMAFVRTLPPLEEGEKDLYETIMEERRIRRQLASEKAR